MVELPLTVNALHNLEMEYHGQIGHTLRRIQHISLTSRIDICYATCSKDTQNVVPNLHGFQVVKWCVQYLDSHPHKPIFYPSNYYDGSNVIIITWSGNQFEDYTTNNCFECHQDDDHAIILKRRRSVSGILYTLLGVFCLLKSKYSTRYSLWVHW